VSADHGHGVVPGRPHDGFRVVVTGKGGVGKSTLTALLATLLAQEGRAVLAVDADPQMNLPHTLGLPPERAAAIVPLSRNADYVEEKTGARPGEGWGVFFRLNPDVRDVVDRFAVSGPDRVRILVMGSVVRPAAGCLCPENSLLEAVVGNLALRDGEAIVMDTQAGVEHFGRAIARGFHHAVVVTDPTFNGIQVALQTIRLAHDLGIPAVHLVLNRVRGATEEERAAKRLADGGGLDLTSLTVLPYDERALEAEPSVLPLLEGGPTPLVTALTALHGALVAGEEALA